MFSQYVFKAEWRMPFWWNLYDYKHIHINHVVKARNNKTLDYTGTHMHTLKEPLSSAKEHTAVLDIPSIALEDYLQDLESLHRDTGYISEQQHTAHEIYDFRLKLDDELNKPVIQPENKSIRLIFASIALIEHIKCNQLSTVYFTTRQGKYYAPHKIAVSMIKEVLTHLHFHQAEYHCEHYECVLEAAIPLMPYLDTICMGLKQPSTMIELQDCDVTANGQYVISIAEMINSFVQRLSDLCHGAKFLAACAQRKKRSAHHLETAKHYLQKLRDYYGRLLVIRLDLHLPHNNKDMPISKLKTKFAAFLQVIRRKRLLCLKGYVWKLEYGFHQSFHYHCLFFLDGRKHAHDIKLAQMLGEIWDQIIEGEHCYFNCNHPKYLKRFQQPITGRLERSDSKKYELILDNVIRYFCKKDQFIIHKSIAHKKTFDTGRLPHVRKHLGRPRTQASKY